MCSVKTHHHSLRSPIIWQWQAICTGGVLSMEAKNATETRSPILCRWQTSQGTPVYLILAELALLILRKWEVLGVIFYLIWLFERHNPMVLQTPGPHVLSAYLSAGNKSSAVCSGNVGHYIPCKTHVLLERVQNTISRTIKGIRKYDVKKTLTNMIWPKKKKNSDYRT